MHCGAADSFGLLALREFREEWKARSWQAALREPDDDALVASLKLSTHTGRPLATDRWLARLEHKLGRRLRPLPVGRPKRVQATKEPTTG